MVLRSKTPDVVLQEIYGYLCVHYALRSLIGEVAHELDEAPPAHLLHADTPGRAAFLGHAPGFLPLKKHAEVFMVFCRQILHHILLLRRDRSNPRVIKRKMS